MGSLPTGARNTRVMVENGNFRRSSCYISETVQDRDIHCVQKKDPLVFSFITFSQINQFAQFAIAWMFSNKNWSHGGHVFLSGRWRIGAHALCVQHSPTAAALSTSFLLNHAPNSPELSALITKFRESYSSVSKSCESKRLKKSSSD